MLISKCSLIDFKKYIYTGVALHNSQFKITIIYTGHLRTHCVFTPLPLSQLSSDWLPDKAILEISAFVGVIQSQEETGGKNLSKL